MRGIPPNGCGPARTRGVAPEVSAQRACERSNERGRGAAGSPDPDRLLGRALFVNDSASFVGGSASFAACFAVSGSPDTNHLKAEYACPTVLRLVLVILALIWLLVPGTVLAQQGAPLVDVALDPGHSRADV